MITGTVFISPPSWSALNTTDETAAVASYESPLLVGPVDAPYDVEVWGPGSTEQSAGSSKPPGFIPRGLLIAKASFGLYAGYGGSAQETWAGEAPPGANFTPPWVPGEAATVSESWYTVPDSSIFRLRLEPGEALYGGLVCWTYLAAQSSPYYWGVSGGSGQVAFIGSVA